MCIGQEKKNQTKVDVLIWKILGINKKKKRGVEGSGITQKAPLKRAPELGKTSTCGVGISEEEGGDGGEKDGKETSKPQAREKYRRQVVEFSVLIEKKGRHTRRVQ